MRDRENPLINRDIPVNRRSLPVKDRTSFQQENHAPPRNK